jgi:hypothetical protein
MCTVKALSMFAIAAFLSMNADANTSPLTGYFVGSGRACYGALKIAEKTISWHTAFSHCKAQPFHLVEESRNAGKQRLTFEFSETASACRFQIISVTHDDGSAPDTGWEVTGYANLASYREDKRSAFTRNAPDTMSCALIRDPEQDPKRRTR